MRTIVLALIAMGSTVPRLAAAEEVAFLGIESRNAAPEARSRVSTAVVEGLRLNGDTTVDAGDASMADLLMMIGCSSISDVCLDDLAAALEADSLIYGSLVSGESGTVLNLVRHNTSAVAVDIQASLDIAPLLAEGDAVLLDVVAALLAGRSVLRVSGDEAMEVSVDGANWQPVPATFTTLFAGAHTVHARRPGEVAVRSIQLGVSEVLDVLISERSFERERVSGGGGDRNGFSSRQWAGIGTMAVGLGALGAGAAFGLQTQSLQEDFNAETRQRAAQDLADDGRRSALLSNVSFGVGAVALGAGVWLLVTGDDTERGVSMAPWGPSGPGATVNVRF